MRLAWSPALALALLTLACARSQPVVPDAGVPAAAVDAGTPDDCTLATKLVPGVPGSPGHLLPSDLNPNGASELATLMRAMQAELREARGVILDGGVPPPMWSHHRRIRCSWPTDPKDRSELFDGLAQSYLVNVQNLDARRPSAAVAFDNVLTACHTCHDNSCPGPLVVIDAMRIVPLDAGVKPVQQ